MAPLAHTLALLAMTVATVAIEVKTLDMAKNSFDDQYRGCGPAMTAALPALINSEFQKNPFFAEIWENAKAEWQRHGSPLPPLSSPDQAIAVLTYTDDVYQEFSDAVPVAGRSPQEYRDNFHYKTLHFLLTQALATLRDAQKGQCLDVFEQACGVQYETHRGDTVRFGEFLITSPSKDSGYVCPEETEFQVHTCHGARLQSSSEYRQYNFVLIPPFETFEVTQVTREGNKTQIQLRSNGTYSKYNCEWLKGGSVPSTPFHLGGFLLATTALALATGIL